jgi:hypothetical protein
MSKETLDCESSASLVALATAGISLYQSMYSTGVIKDMPDAVKSRYSVMQKLIKKIESGAQVDVTDAV